MAIKCPQCGAEFDVTLFTFDRKIQCDCGAWVDLAVGHQQAAKQGSLQHLRGPTGILRRMPTHGQVWIRHQDAHPFR